MNEKGRNGELGSRWNDKKCGVRRLLCPIFCGKSEMEVV